MPDDLLHAFIQIMEEEKAKLDHAIATLKSSGERLHTAVTALEAMEVGQISQ